MSTRRAGGLATVIVHMLGLWLLACSSGSEHGNPEAPLPDGGERPSSGGGKGGDDRPDDGGGKDGGFGNDLPSGSCERELWLRPDAERTRYRCEPTGGPFSENPTGWQCTCGQDEEKRPWQPGDAAAARCERIIADVCDVDLERRNFCEHAGGTCWPNPDGDDAWDCACGDMPEAGALVSMHADSCEAAAFARCATDCEDTTGQCSPSAELDRFDCSCDYFGTSRDTPAARCALALAGCNPQLNDVRDASGLACSGFAGFCDEVGDALRCTCADGSTHEQPLADLEEHSAEACGGELQDSCGNGVSQAEAFRCSVEQDDGRDCSAGLRFADDRYDCHCESLNACNEEYDLRDSDLAAATCAEALDACVTADSALAHPAAPECADDP